MDNEPLPQLSLEEKQAELIHAGAVIHPRPSYNIPDISPEQTIIPSDILQTIFIGYLQSPIITLDESLLNSSDSSITPDRLWRNTLSPQTLDYFSANAVRKNNAGSPYSFLYDEGFMEKTKSYPNIAQAREELIVFYENEFFGKDESGQLRQGHIKWDEYNNEAIVTKVNDLSHLVLNLLNQFPKVSNQT